MDGIEFFDCDVIIGNRGYIFPGSYCSTKKLLEQMDKDMIKKAVVCHNMCTAVDPAEGNKALMEEVRGNDRLVPAWTVMHHHTDEFFKPDMLYNEMKKNDIRAVRLACGFRGNRFSPSAWSCGEMYSVFQECRVPVMMSLIDISPDKLADICRDFDSMIVILTKGRYDMERDLFALMDLLPNIYVATKEFGMSGTVEKACGRFGPERLIFGSGMPIYCAAAAAGTIRYADLAYDEKKLIAGGNLERLTGGVRYV